MTSARLTISVLATAKKSPYLICYGTIESNDSNKATTVNVSRSQVLVNSSEYTVYDGSQGSPYPGYAFIRFIKEQIDFSGSPYELTADIRGLKLGGDTSATRNFVRVIQYLLSNSTWGLGLSVDTTSFDTAAGQMTDLLCDGFISEQKRCSDILNELLFCCRGGISYNESGAITIKCDVYDSAVNYTFGHKDGFYENIIEISENRKTPISESFKSFSLNYGWNNWEGQYSYCNKRSIFTFGEEKIMDCSLIQDHTTADRITCYQKNRMTYGDRRLTILVGMEARNIEDGKNVKVILPDYGINADFQVRRIEKKNMNTFSLELNSWDAAIYDYSAGSMPNDANDDSQDDYSGTPPSPPTNFVKISEGTYQGSDGTTYAYIFLAADAPTDDNFAKIIFGYRKNGETYYRYVDGNKPASGNTWNARIDGLVPGLYYDYIAISVNTFSQLSSGNPTLTNQLAPGDTSGPSGPTGLTATAAFKNIFLDWTNHTDSDLKHIEVWRSNTNDRTQASKIAEVDADTYTDYIGTYGTTRYYWIRAKDSANYSAWYPTSPTGGVSATTAQISESDLLDLAVTSAKLAASAVITSKLADLAVDNTKLANLAVDAAKLAASAVTSTKIANAAVGSAAIANLAVGTAHIQDSAIQSAKIGDLQVITSKINNLAVTSGKIVDAAILNAKIADLAVDEAKIASLAVSTLKIQNNAVTVPVNSFTSGEISCPTGVETTIQQITVSVVSNVPYSLFCSIQPYNPGASETEYYYYLYGDSTLLYMTGNSLNMLPGKRLLDAFSYVDTPISSATVTYYLKLKPASQDMKAYNRSLMCIGCKK
jgi:hypothetical protein